MNMSTAATIELPRPRWPEADNRNVVTGHGAATPSEARAATALHGVAAHLGAPLSLGNRIEPLFNGAEIFPPMLSAIASARETVNFLTYVYWKGEIARVFADALSAAARRGVEVRVLIDAVGGALMSERLVEEMRQAGCRITRFNPLHRGSIYKNNWRTHRKVLVVDGRRGFTGGVGIGEEWTGDAQDADHWRDDHFDIVGPVVHYLQGAFSDNWHCETGESLSHQRFFPRLDTAGSAAVVPILGRPASDPSPVGLGYRLLLAEATRSVELCTPYFVPDDDALEALCEARARGVRVRLLIPGPHNDSRLAQWACEGLLSGIVDHGIEVYRYLPTMNHAKAATFDDRYTIIGSANYDCRSFELNHELNLLIEDRELALRMKAGFEHDLESSVPVTGADLDRRPVWKKLRSRAALLLRSQL